MKILAIDTSCDDTSVAIADNLDILANVFWSKIKTYAKWGGIVPSEAKRQHKEFLGPALKEAFVSAHLDIKDIDVVAVTQGPGLAIALEAGMQKAKELATKHNKKLIAVNHMVGHVYSNLTRDENGNSCSGLNEFKFPLLALTISGGHTDLYLMYDHLKFEHIGKTLDDAVGEAFDKVGRMLGMSFPAGPKVEQSALNGNSAAFSFPRPLSNTNDYNWSFSGLKTAVLYQIRKIMGDYQSRPGKRKYKIEDFSKLLDQKTINDLAASFQQAAIDSLVIKILRAVENYKPKMLVVGGGVIANIFLRNQLKEKLTKQNTPLYYPRPLWLCTDNAAMIASAAYFYAKAEKYVLDLKKLDRDPSMSVL